MSETGAPRLGSTTAAARPARRGSRLVRRHLSGVFGATVLLLMVVAAVFARWLAPYDPLETNYTLLVHPPTLQHLLGTDPFGRDVLSRLIYGARTALLIGLVSSVVSATLGLLVGAASAYFGGTADLILERVTDMLLCFPLIVLALAVVAVLGPGTAQVIAAIVVPMVPRATRVVRSSALAIRQMPYVESAHAAGASDLRVILRHLLPNVVAPYLILLTAFLADAIILEASLSFLGLGVVEPTPAWGLMLRDFAGRYAESAPWLPLAPGLAISLAVFGSNLLGDAARDALDPRLRGRA
ncbi:MAG TPA: ABC transporter permease [bacterium]|nr:ABC transporter permease [bacterium]